MKRSVPVTAVSLTLIFIMTVIAPAQSASAGSIDGGWPMLGGDYTHSGASRFNGSGNNGTLAWRYPEDPYGSSLLDATPVVGTDGTLYLARGLDLFGLLAINSSGKMKWFYKTTLDDSTRHASPALDKNGNVYFCAGNKILSLYPNGTLRWSCPFNEKIISGITIKEDDGAIIFCTENNLYNFKPSGLKSWNYSMQVDRYSSSTIDDQGTIYNLNINPRALIAINKNGMLRWTYPLTPYGICTPVVHKDTIYITDSKENLTAINLNGTMKWVYHLQTNSRMPAVGDDSIVYCPSIDGLHAIYPNGTLKWVFPYEGMVIPGVITSDGIIFGRTADRLLAISTNGALRWSFEAIQIHCPPVMGNDGTVYIVGRDGIYAIGEPQPHPADPTGGTDFGTLTLLVAIPALFISGALLLLYRRKRHS